MKAQHWVNHWARAWSCENTPSPLSPSSATSIYWKLIPRSGVSLSDVATALPLSFLLLWLLLLLLLVLSPLSDRASALITVDLPES
jgi:hypothetical protein